MGNKTQLQLNNETLGSILSNVLGLPSQESLKQGAYVWKKLTADGGDFIDFVVSDSETAYPDGGTKDGYWYEKVVEGVDLLSMFGYSNIAIDKFTPAGNQRPSDFPLPHSLNAIPKLIMIGCKSDEAKGGFYFHAIFNVSNGSGSNYIGGGGIYVSGSSYGQSGSESGIGQVQTATDKAIAFYSSSNGIYFKAGVEYTLITMA